MQTREDDSINPSESQLFKTSNSGVYLPSFFDAVCTMVVSPASIENRVFQMTLLVGLNVKVLAESMFFDSLDSLNPLG